MALSGAGIAGGGTLVGGGVAAYGGGVALVGTVDLGQLLAALMSMGADTENTSSSSGNRQRLLIIGRLTMKL